MLWHAYPRIGFDPRNQFDFYRDMPGGLSRLRALNRTCHSRGVRVFINYNPWDTGTRREGESDVRVLAELVGEIEADGIFLDTLDRGASEFRSQLDAVGPGVVLESELALPVAGVADHHLSWAQWFSDRSSGGTTPVKAFPAGRSPFGADDFCGNVWHWTESERSDGRTRFCILKGGSWFRANGSHWYADGGPQPCRFSAKFLLTWAGLDRCASVGFRCVRDL